MKRYLMIFLILAITPFIVLSQFSPETVIRVDRLVSNTLSLIKADSPIEAQEIEVLGPFKVTSTTSASTPCPEQTQLQRDALTPSRGDCVYNTDTLQVNFFDGVGWVLVGGGGLERWENTKDEYEVDDVIWEPTSLKIYVANTTHAPSTDFIDDIANWTELSNPFDGTNLEISPNTITQTDTAENLTLAVQSGQFVDIQGSMEIADDLTVYGASNLNSILIDQGEIKELLGPLNIVSAEDENITLEMDGAGDLLVNYGSSTLSLDPQNTRSILPNGSFERGVAGITCNDATATSEDTIKHGDVNNNLSLKIEFTDVDGYCDIPLDLTDVASGSSFTYFGFVKTALLSVDMCLVIDSLERDCIEISGEDKFGQYGSMNLTGATSTAIRIKSGAVGDAYADRFEANLGSLPTAPSQNCKGGLDCVNVFSATVAGNGTVSGEGVDWINGSCTSASPRVCSLNVSDLNCSSSGNEEVSYSSSSISITGNTNPTEVICHRKEPKPITEQGVYLTGGARGALVQAVVAGGQSIGTSATVFQLAAADINSLDGFTFVDANDEFVALKRGRYELSLGFVYTNGANNSVGQFRVQVDTGSGYVSRPLCGTARTVTSVAIAPIARCLDTVDLSKGDKLRISLISDASGTTINSLTSSTLQIRSVLDESSLPIAMEGVARIEGEDNKRFVSGSASFGGGTDLSVCSTGTCGRYREVGNLGRNISAAFVSTGQYDITVSGLKANTPLDCWEIGSSRTTSTHNNLGMDAWNMFTNAAGAATFSAFTTSGASTALSNAYFRIKCEGQAP